MKNLLKGILKLCFGLFLLLISIGVLVAIFGKSDEATHPKTIINKAVAQEPESIPLDRIKPLERTVPRHLNADSIMVMIAGSPLQYYFVRGLMGSSFGNYVGYETEEIAHDVNHRSEHNNLDICFEINTHKIMSITFSQKLTSLHPELSEASQMFTFLDIFNYGASKYYKKHFRSIVENEDDTTDAYYDKKLKIQYGLDADNLFAIRKEIKSDPEYLPYKSSLEIIASVNFLDTIIDPESLAKSLATQK